MQRTWLGRYPAYRLMCGATVSLVAIHVALAQEGHIAPVRDFIRNHIASLASDPFLISSLKRRNAANASLSANDILTLDKEWRRQLESDKHPLIDSVLAAPLSKYLKARENEAAGAITEMIVMDARGLNVGQSGVTSDYWQGDEEKFRRSFKSGADAVFIDVARTDESTMMFQSQVSMTIVDEQGTPIGAITVGVNLDEL